MSTDDFPSTVARPDRLRFAALLLLWVAGLLAASCAAASSLDDVAATSPEDATGEAALAEQDADSAPDSDQEADQATESPRSGNQPEKSSSTPTQVADTAADIPSDEEPVATPSPQASPSPALTPTPEASGLDDFGDALPPAPIGFDDLDRFDRNSSGPRPVALEIEGIDVVDATVIPVGVNPDQTFEVPPADQVGWYRFGPAPGEEGSAVLAAHIAFDGVDGVFRHLADVEVGSIVSISFDDGSQQRYRIESLTEYVKEELPSELFARDGESSLALITCGGAFNRQLQSYDSNVVAVAVPLSRSDGG